MLVVVLADVRHFLAVSRSAFDAVGVGVPGLSFFTAGEREAQGEGHQVEETILHVMKTEIERNERIWAKILAAQQSIGTGRI